MSASALDDKRLAACVGLLGRAGAHGFQIRFHDDEQPTVWIAVVEWRIGSERHWECAAGLDPLRATFALCEHVIDGGECKHCERPTGVSLDLHPMPMRREVCWYQYDPELQTFRRSCE